ncbi:MAG: acetyl-CoA carboxylase biotin carboxyl carrier protein [Sphaerochaetaceae bacterium]|nr:acetyl-CoA carboxylase biotin carboxyl carrier protein [Sphaerochaetaceae bacterium]MDC7236346.1 acetyl-CoA carboxylase biotin carboxyl carrier protein [Sphaerochaetaceae bacterium]MDC7249188.1 acetyl-CoA carboxylase biotin carboxyl carrier protein [Sphaerochaetaceae bacterium]
MENLDIDKILDRFENSSICELEITYKDFQIKCKKNTTISQEITKEIVKTKKEEITTSEIKDEKIKTITSPIVGTFYRAPAPDANVYVEPNQEIKKGQPICIIEAMKMMNELESEFNCKIIEVLANSGQLVEYGQPLFKVELI